jgi:hypothetical protein
MLLLLFGLSLAMVHVVITISKTLKIPQKKPPKVPQITLPTMK